MVKRSISIMLCAMILFALAPMTAFAAESLDYKGDCSFNESGVLVITGDAVLLGGNGEVSITVAETAGNVIFKNLTADKVTINGGRITATGSNGITANNVEINGGTLYAKGTANYGIKAGSSIVVNGGKTTATGANGAVCCAGELKCSVSVQQGKTANGTNMKDASIEGGRFVVDGNEAVSVWLASVAVCEHKNTTVVNAKAASCNEAGYSGDVICKDCLITVKNGTEIKAPGHIYYDGKCLRCGEADPSEHFTDTDGITKSYKTAIQWAADRGIATGYKQSNGTSKFYPNNLCTRAQVVTFIWRANGSPSPTSHSNPFRDVDSQSPFYTAILWAAEKGIVSGYEDGTFRPNGACTRAHVVTFIWRSEGKPQYRSVAKFGDVSGLNADFTKAIYWAAEKGVTTGYPDGTFHPINVCTRAQVVTFIYRDMN